MELGIVDQFDEQRGLGTVRSPRHGLLSFHCAVIADGTRTIEVGVPVAFRVVAGELGRFEAREVQPLATVSSSP
jgi:cold shock CspA family protein